MKPSDLLEKLAQEEKEAYEGTFLAPVIRGAQVQVRISGIVHRFTVRHKQKFRNYQGWAILKVWKNDIVEVVEDAPQALVSKYLELFPQVRFVLLDRFEGEWYGLMAAGSEHIQIGGPVPLYLCSIRSIGRFDTAYCRFDGERFYFDRLDRRRDPGVARSLNESLVQKVLPENLRCLGAVPAEHLAYKFLFVKDNEASLRKKPVDLRDSARMALEHGGAVLQDFRESKNNSQIRFTLDGRVHNVVVDKNLGVISSGICLSGRDRDFDLASLVSVFKEGARNRYDWH